MRSYFATDAKTIEHFKKLRKVELHKKGATSNLILHDEAATRLEAVRDELPAGSMPDTTVGWPRGTPRCTPRAASTTSTTSASPSTSTPPRRRTSPISPEGPDPARHRRAGLAERRVEEGEYADMAKGTEQRAPMAEPDPKSELGKQLAKVESEAKAASERSEAFRTSIDAKALLDLRTKRRSNRAAWAQGRTTRRWPR